MKKILITTTESLFGWEIQSYLKPIFSNVVVGAGFLSDFSASITDVFGGRSSSYEKTLQSINDNALKILQSKASELGANCILGLKMSVHQISGKNVQMFMVSAYGTAVIAKNLQTQRVSTSSKEIDKHTVIDKAKLIKLLNSFSNADFALKLDDLQMIVDSKSSEFRSYILEKVKTRAQATLGMNDDVQKQADKLYSEYFAVIDPIHAKDELFNGLLNATHNGVRNQLLEIIEAHDLVDYKHCIALLQSNTLLTKKAGLIVLSYSKPFYTSEDIKETSEMITIIKQSFPSTANVGMKKGFLSSSEKEVWTCTCGKTNSISDKYCYGCSNDQFGFKEAELSPEAVIKYLNNIVLALEEAFQITAS